MEHLVDTPVRGFVYEAAGAVEPRLLERGAHIVREASETGAYGWRWSARTPPSTKRGWRR